MEYFHLECISHEIIMAEGLMVETYLDTGDRAVFDNGGSAISLHPQLQLNIAAKTWADACAPLLTDAGIAQSIWQTVADRASALGYRAPEGPETSDDARLHLLANGMILPPIGLRDGNHIFALPARRARGNVVVRHCLPSG